MRQRVDGKGYRAYIRTFIHLIKYIMKKKCEVTKFREGDTKEHEGVTYAVCVPQVWRTVQKPKRVAMY